MKKRFLKLFLPIGLGMVLSVITLFALVGCEPIDDSGTGGGGGGCNNGCGGNTPWRCGGYCYSSPPSGNHSCTKCN
jgi:hypothetical protein